jgi:hypothetical protein
MMDNNTDIGEKFKIDNTVEENVLQPTQEYMKNT